MAHVVNNGKEYLDLADKYDRSLLSVTNKEAFCKVLTKLVTGTEAELALLIPTTFISYEELRAKARIDRQTFNNTLLSLSNKGIVFDIQNGKCKYYSLSPIVIGFFEFTLMRKNLGSDRDIIVRLFDDYMDNLFFDELFSSSTAYNRVILSAKLDFDEATQIKSYQSANIIIDEAYSIAVSICACRHHKSHMGKSCNHEEENCISLNYAAEYLIRNKLARKIEKSEAKDIICKSADNGLVQTVDNVKKLPGYICNCCSCCCGMISGIKKYGYKRAVASSGFYPDIYHLKCTGCGLCTRYCPLDAIILNDNNQVVVDKDICFGCGLCATHCRSSAIIMSEDSVKIIIPDTVIEKNILIALEKGKLLDLIFSDITYVNTKIMRKVLGITGISGFGKILGSFAPIKSAFLIILANSYKKKYPDLKGIMYY